MCAVHFPFVKHVSFYYFFIQIIQFLLQKIMNILLSVHVFFPVINSHNYFLKITFYPRQIHVMLHYLKTPFIQLQISRSGNLSSVSSNQKSIACLTGYTRFLKGIPYPWGFASACTLQQNSSLN